MGFLDFVSFGTVLAHESLIGGFVDMFMSRLVF